MWNTTNLNWWVYRISEPSTVVTSNYMDEEVVRVLRSHLLAHQTLVVCSEKHSKQRPPKSVPREKDPNPKKIRLICVGLSCLPGCNRGKWRFRLGSPALIYQSCWSLLLGRGTPQDMWLVTEKNPFQSAAGDSITSQASPWSKEQVLQSQWVVLKCQGSRLNWTTKAHPKTPKFKSITSQQCR